jgi:dynamin 1-like protein
VRRSIRKLEAPGLTCLQLVYDELLKIAEAAAPPELARFPVLQRRLAAAVLEFIQVCVGGEGGWGGGGRQQAHV